jgi:hypothetical protein
MDDTLMAVLVIGGYLAVSIALLVLVWRLSRRVASTFARVVVRAATAAVLFAPTFFACGGASPVPFPILVVSDISTALSPPREYSCGYQASVPFNISIVLGTWATIVSVSMLVIWVRRSIQRRTSNMPLKERPRVKHAAL